MYSIGNLSIITRLTVKTLRHYHELGLLVPDHVDEESNYRYYGESALDRARVIQTLRELEFSLKEIGEILSGCSEDEDILEYLERQKNRMEKKAQEYREKSHRLNQMTDSIRRTKMARQSDYKVTEKRIDEMLFAGILFQGRYEEVGKQFGIIARKAGRHLAGPAMSLYYDSEYRENDARIEAGFPVKKEIKGEGISCRRLSGGTAITLIHKGPYDRIGGSYETILHFLTEQGLSTLLPSREIYRKGPGMIFRGNPERYLTEIQFLLAES